MYDAKSVLRVGTQLDSMSMKAIRIDRGLTQADLAKAVGVTKKTVSSWESGKTHPSVDKVDAVCRALNVAYDHVRWNV